MINSDADYDDYRDQVPLYDSSAELVAQLKKSRCNCLLMAIAVLQGVADQRAMEAGIEVLRAALADLDAWEKGMGAMIERDLALSLGELRQH